MKQLIFNNGIQTTGGLTVNHNRNVATVDDFGAAVAPDAIRYAKPRLEASNTKWETIPNSPGPTAENLLQWGVGTNADGDPLLVTINTGGWLRVYEGYDFTLHDEQVMLSSGNVDMMQGEVSDHYMTPIALHAYQGRIFCYGYVRTLPAKTFDYEAMVYREVSGTNWHIIKTIDHQNWHTPINGSANRMRTKLWAFPSITPSIIDGGYWLARADYLINTGSPGGMGVLSKVDTDGTVRGSRVLYRTDDYTDKGLGCHAHTMGVLERDGKLYCLLIFGDGDQTEWKIIIVNDPANYETCGLTVIDGWMGSSAGGSDIPRSIQPVSLVTLSDHSGWVAGSDNEAGSQLLIRLPADPSTQPPIVSHVGGHIIGTEQGNLALFTSRQIGGSALTGNFGPREESDISTTARRTMYSVDGELWDEASVHPEEVKFYGSKLIRVSGNHFQFASRPIVAVSRREALVEPGGTNCIGNYIGINTTASGSTVIACPKVGDRFVWPTDPDPAHSFAKEGQEMPPLPSKVDHVFAIYTKSAHREIANLYGALNEVGSVGRVVPRFYVLSEGSGAMSVHGIRWGRLSTPGPVWFSRWAPTEHWLELLKPTEVTGTAPYQWRTYLYSDSFVDDIGLGGVEYAIAFDNVAPGNWAGYPLGRSATGPDVLLSVSSLSLGSEHTVLGRIRPRGWDSNMAYGVNSNVQPLFTEYLDANNFVEWRYVSGADDTSDGKIQVAFMVGGVETTVDLTGIWLNKDTPIDWWRAQDGVENRVGVCIGNELVVTGTFAGVISQPVEIRYSDANQSTVTPIAVSSLRIDENSALTEGEIESIRLAGTNIVLPHKLPLGPLSEGVITP